jgi:hypothetical protein
VRAYRPEPPGDPRVPAPPAPALHGAPAHEPPPESAPHHAPRSLADEQLAAASVAHLPSRLREKMESAEERPQRSPLPWLIAAAVMAVVITSAVLWVRFRSQPAAPVPGEALTAGAPAGAPASAPAPVVPAAQDSAAARDTATAAPTAMRPAVSARDARKCVAWRRGSPVPGSSSSLWAASTR